MTPMSTGPQPCMLPPSSNRFAAEGSPTCDCIVVTSCMLHCSFFCTCTCLFLPPVCLSVCLCICLCIHLSVCLSVCLCSQTSAFSFACLPVHLSVRTSVCLPVCPGTLPLSPDPLLCPCGTDTVSGVGVREGLTVPMCRLRRYGWMMMSRPRALPWLCAQVSPLASPPPPPPPPSVATPSYLLHSLLTGTKPHVTSRNRFLPVVIALCLVCEVTLGLSLEVTLGLPLKITLEGYTSPVCLHTWVSAITGLT